MTLSKNQKWRKKAKQLNATYHPASEGKSPFMEYSSKEATGRVIIQDGDTLDSVRKRMNFVPNEYRKHVKNYSRHERRNHY